MAKIKIRAIFYFYRLPYLVTSTPFTTGTINSESKETQYISLLLG